MRQPSPTDRVRFTEVVSAAREHAVTSRSGDAPGDAAGTVVFYWARRIFCRPPHGSRRAGRVAIASGDVARRRRHDVTDTITGT